MFAQSDDDRFGLVGLGQAIFWICNVSGLVAGLVFKLRRPAIREPGPLGVSEGLRDPDIVFAVLLASLPPAFAFYFAWFGGMGGATLRTSLIVLIASAIGVFVVNGLKTGRWLGGAGVFGLVSTIAWAGLTAYAYQTGLQAQASARLMANGSPYCVESRLHALSTPWDMTILNMRIRPSSPFNTTFHAQLIINRDGRFERYHWSHRSGVFNGNGRAFDESFCLRKFGTSADIERRKAE